MGLESSQGIAAARNQIKEYYKTRFDTERLAYYSSCMSLIKARKNSVIPLKIRQDFVHFGKFEAKSGYFGRLPSIHYLTNIFNVSVEQKQDYFDMEMERRVGELLKVDHSFKVSCFYQDLQTY